MFHLAAVSNVNDAFERPLDCVAINITGTANVWEACRRNGVRRAVLASTVWVYAGARGDGPFDEDTPFHLPSAGHIYTSSKIADELIVHNYAELYNQPFTILRYGIPFGPRMRDALVIPLFVRRALAGETITINGDGSQFRNYVYISDLARAHVLALGPAAENEVFNLEGRGEGQHPQAGRDRPRHRRRPRPDRVPPGPPGRLRRQGGLGRQGRGRARLDGRHALRLGHGALRRVVRRRGGARSPTGTPTGLGTGPVPVDAVPGLAPAADRRCGRRGVAAHLVARAWCRSASGRPCGPCRRAGAAGADPTGRRWR